MRDPQRRLAREEAVAAIIAGKKTRAEVAEEMKVTRQAVSKWMELYRERGDLVAKKRGRLRTPVLTNAQKLQIRAGVAAWLEENGVALGAYIPRRKRPPLEVISQIMARVLNRKSVSKALARRTARALEIPHYLEPLEGFAEDFDYPDEQLVFELDWIPGPRPPARLPEEGVEPPGSLPSMPVRKRRRGRPPKKKSEPDPDDPFALEEDEELLPQDIGDYQRWVKETKALIARREAGDTGKASLPAPGAARKAGVRTGKHAKGTAPARRRGKKRKKRR